METDYKTNLFQNCPKLSSIALTWWNKKKHFLCLEIVQQMITCANNAYNSRKFQNYDNSKIITLIRISKKCRLN